MKFAWLVSSVLLLLSCGSSWSETNNIGSTSSMRFNYIGIEKGLSQATVLSILQDKQGFMWFATQDGLNRFDGYDFKVFRKDANDPDSLTENYINSIFQDSSEYIWLTTRNGLNRYDPRSNKFTRFFFDAEDPYSVSSDWTFGVNEDRHGNIWVGSYEHGLNLYDPNTERFTRYQHDPDDDSSLSDNGIYHIFVDRVGTLWVATRNGGVNRYNAQNDSFEHFTHDPSDPQSIGHNRVYRIFQHSDGTMWFATRGGGLSRFDAATETFKTFVHDANDPNSISSDHVWSIIEDRQGNLLIGTFTEGLNRLKVGTEQFERIVADASNKFAISGNSVISSFADNTGLIWFGVRGSGINFLNQDIGFFNHNYHLPNEPNSLSDNSVQSFIQLGPSEVLIATRGGGINRYDPQSGEFSLLHDVNDPLHQVLTRPINQMIQDKQGNLWITLKDDGLVKFNLTTNKLQQYLHDPNDPTSISDNSVMFALLDENEKIWLGTRKGLNYFDPQTGQAKRFYHNPDDLNTISNDWIGYLKIDYLGDLWVATQNGLDRLDLNTETFEHFKARPDQPDSLSSNSIMSLFEDSAQQMWVSTSGGLNRYDATRGSFARLTEQNGLSNEQVYGVVEDDSGVLWLITNFGLYRYDTKNNTIKQFTEKDGLQNNEFNQGAFLKLEDGRLMFGGVNGFNIFDPKEISDNPYPPKVMLTNFRIFNQTVPVGEFKYQALKQTYLSNSINHTQSITLTHKESVFSFEFSAMHYAAPSRNQYAYRLVGFDQQWTYTDHKNRRATYTNLEAGTYTFEVKASNKDGLWASLPTSVNISILAPWWLTRGAKFIWLGLFFMVIFLVFRLKTRRIQQQKTELQLQVTRQVAQVVAQKQALERSYHDIKVISAIGKKINASLDLEKVLWTVYEHINQLMDGTIFGIGLYKPEQNLIQIELAMEKGNRYKPYSRSMENKAQFPVWCIDNNEVVFINDLELDGRRYLERHEYDEYEANRVFLEDGAYAGPPQSLVYVPIRSTDKILGFITVQSFNKHAYQEVHVDILNTLAAYTGTAIINSIEHQRLIDSRTELLESEKMASLGSLIAGVAHEINTPVGICLTTASNLQQHSDQLIEAKAQGSLTTQKFDQFNQLMVESLKLLMNNLMKTSELIGHFKDVVVNHSVENKSRFNVKELVEQTIKTTQAELDHNNITMEFICDEQIVANTYASSLSRVISTLILNSIMHAFEGKKTKAGKIIIYIAMAGSELHICFKDNGKGMDKKLASQIFEPFYTTKRNDGCLGLGMHVVYNQVTQGLHGIVKCTSSIGQGMQIDIHIPIQNY